MNISDLDYLDTLAETAQIDCNGSAGASVGVWGWGLGDYSRSWATTRTYSRVLPNGSSIAFGFGIVGVFAFTPAPTS